MVPKTKNGKKRLGVTLGAIGVGAAIGASTAPEDEKPSFHAVTWGAVFGLVAKFVADYIWSDQQELEETKKDFEDYKTKNEFIKIDEKLGYMIDKKSGKNIKVIYEVHKGRKVIPINDQEKYIAETILKARPVNQDEDLNKDNKK